MPKSVIDLSYCMKCGCNLQKLESVDPVCDDCKEIVDQKTRSCDEDDTSCCIKDDETELEPDYFEDEDCFYQQEEY